MSGAGRIEKTDGAGDDALLDDALLDEIASAPDGPPIIHAMSRHPSALVRSWAAAVAVDVLDPAEAVDLLQRLATSDRDEDKRPIARQIFEEIDPSLTSTFVPQLYPELKRAKDPYGAAAEAMWRLASIGDPATSALRAATELDTPIGKQAARVLAANPPDDDCASVFGDSQISSRLRDQ